MSSVELEAGIASRAAIVGIGQTEFARSLDRSETEMAVEAIWRSFSRSKARGCSGPVQSDQEVGGCAWII